ncbi:MAG: alpha/beta hydrolase-fold protein [Sulfurifustis sp.]
MNNKSRARLRRRRFLLALMFVVGTPAVGTLVNAKSMHAHAAEAAASLYQGPAPRPGPDILYAAPPRAPQLENTGAWGAGPILISGASAYRKGEFLYQDFLYDDHGANGGVPDPNDPRTTGSAFSGPNGTYTYPTDPVYANNAADFVELRVKPAGQATLFRVTLNTLIDPARVAFTIAIGQSPAAVEFPHGANARAPAELFLTVHGQTADLINAASGQPVAPAPTVSVDLVRRQFEVRVAKTAWDPGQRVVRLAAGVGLWDVTNGRYLIPAAAATATTPGGAGALLRPPAFFNVAFRFDEPMPDPSDLSQTGNAAWWRDGAQGEALRGGDISGFFAMVDFAKLAKNVTDDMRGLPTGVPQSGPMDRIFASHFETKQGVDFTSECGEAAACKGELLGQLQPYAIYVPVKPQPADGYGFTLLLHSLSANYNQYLGSLNQSQLGERGRGHIIATPAGRGPDGWYVDHAAADTFEVWNDVARNYRLDPALTSISGYSMGGYGTFKFATRYPDLFAKAHTVVGPPALGIWAPPASPTGGESTNTFNLLEGVRNIPFLMWVQVTDELVPYSGTSAQAQRFDQLGYRYEFDSFTTGEHLTLALNDQYEPSAAFLGDARVDRDPAHVTYVVNPRMDFPDAGLVGDHAYWLSGLRLRDASGDAPRGTIDVFSHGFGVGDAPPLPTQTGAGLLTGGNLGALAFVSQSKAWGAAPVQLAANRLDITARNIAAVVVHVDRARVGCDVVLNVDTDGPLTVTLQGCGREARFP